jgi:hypothetical protein
VSTVDDLARRIVALERALATQGSSAQLAYSSVENGPVPVYDGSGKLRSQIGRQFDGTFTVVDRNGSAPPQTTAPVCAAAVGGYTATWDGAWAEVLAGPLDVRRVEVHDSLAPGFTADQTTRRATIESAGGASVGVETGDYFPRYVRFVAVNTSGVPGPSSLEVEVIPVRVDTGDIAAGSVGDAALTQSLAGSIGQKLYDTMDDAGLWQVVTGPVPTTVATTEARTGGFLMRGDGLGSKWYARRGLIPFDPDVLYRVTARLRVLRDSTTGAGLHYAGVVGVAADGVTLVNRTGLATFDAQHYAALSGAALTVASGWVTATGYVRGHAATTAASGAYPDPFAPQLLHPSVRYLRPVVVHDLPDSNGAMEWDLFTVEVVETGAVQQVRSGTVGVRAEIIDDEMRLYDAEGETVYQGSAEAVGVSHLVADRIDSPSILSRVDAGQSIEYSVDSATGNDDANDGSSAAPLRSMREAINRLPKYITGLATILLAPTHREDGDLKIEGLTGGGDLVVRRSVSSTDRPRLDGRLWVQGCNVYVRVDHLIVNLDRADSGVFIDRCLYAACVGVDVHGPGALVDFSHGFETFASKVTFDNCGVHAVADGFLIRFASVAAIQNSRGDAGVNGIFVDAAVAFLTGTQVDSPDLVDARNGALVGGTATADTAAAPTPPPAPRKSSVFFATRTESWRDNLGWRYQDAIGANSYPYQGEWNNNGLHKGLWFFDSAAIRSALSGRTIVSVRFRLRRRGKGGESAARQPTFRHHNYDSPPVGEPALSSSHLGAYWAWGEEDTTTLPNAWGVALRDGTARGVAIFDADGSPYMIFEQYGRLEIVHE